jgi:uncharacterized protein YkwD
MSIAPRILALAFCLAAMACTQTSALKPGHVVRGNAAAVTLDPGAATAMVSQYRSGRRLETVRLDPQLNGMAQVLADAMAAKGVLSHDAAGPFRQRLGNAGIATTKAGENIAAGYFSLDDAIGSWKRSPEHNANLLMPGVTRFGIALAKSPGRGYQTYWAMVVAGDPPEPMQVATLSTGPLVRRPVPASQGSSAGSVLSTLSAPFSGLFGH